MDILTKHIQKPLLARVAISCGQDLVRKGSVCIKTTYRDPNPLLVPNYIFSTNKKKIVRFLLHAEQSWTWGKAEEQKGKALIQAPRANHKNRKY